MDGTRLGLELMLFLRERPGNIPHRADKVVSLARTFISIGSHYVFVHSPSSLDLKLPSLRRGERPVVCIPGATESAKPLPRSAQKRDEAVARGGTEVCQTVHVERRKLRGEIVDNEPRRRMHDDFPCAW